MVKTIKAKVFHLSHDVVTDVSIVRLNSVRLAHTETSAVSEYAYNTGHKPPWNEVKFIVRDPYYNTHRVKEAIRMRLHPNNINRDSGIEISEAWMPTIKKHNNRRAVRQRTAEGANHRVKTARIEMHQSEPLKNN